MKVLFLSPHYPEEMQDFTRGLAEVGAQVYAAGDVPRDQIPDHVRRYLSGYIEVRGLFDDEAAVTQLVPAVRSLGLDRIETLWEPLVTLAAKLRVALGVPGMSPETALAFRDKGLMKQRLLKAGLRVPRSARVSTIKEAMEAAEQIGYPLIVKPIDGAGTRDTYLATDTADLETVLGRVRHLPEASVEEYIDGEELTYDTVCVDGIPAFESVAQYHPKPLIGRSEEWVSPAQIVFRDPYQAKTRGGVELGRKVLRAMGMGTGFTHMEWFRTPSGEAVFGEIAARSPGGKLVDQMNFSNDFDIYREWARTVCWRSFEGQIQRKYNVAVVFKRAEGQGRITGTEGLGQLRARCGEWLIVEDLLPIGARRRDWKNTLLSDGWLAVRHPDYDECIDMMHFAVSNVRMYAA